MCAAFPENVKATCGSCGVCVGGVTRSVCVGGVSRGVYVCGVTRGVCVGGVFRVLSGVFCASAC